MSGEYIIETVPADEAEEYLKERIGGLEKDDISVEISGPVQPIVINNVLHYTITLEIYEKDMLDTPQAWTWGN